MVTNNGEIKAFSGSRMRMTAGQLILLLILLMGLITRLYQLGEESLWHDEGVSVRIAQTESTLEILNPGQLDDNPPFYYLILHGWVKVFGASEFSVRFPSLIFSVVTVFFLYKLAFLLYEEKTALGAAGLLCLSGYHVYYAQEARGYTLMALESVISMYFFVKLNAKSNRANGIGYVISSTLLLYTHSYSLFVILGQNLYLSGLAIFSPLSRRIRWKNWLLLQGGLVILFVPWLRVLLGKIIRIQTTGLLWAPSILDVPGAFKTFSGDSAWMGVFFILLAGGALIWFKQNGAGKGEAGQMRSGKTIYRHIGFSHLEQGGLLWCWLGVLIILPYVISLVSTPIMQSRYLIAASPAFYILVSRGIFNLNRKLLIFLTAGVVLGFYPGEIYRNYNRTNKEAWREAVGRLENEAEAGDAVLVNANYCLGNIYNYYGRRTDLDKNPFPKEGKEISEENIRHLTAIAEKYDRIWLVLSHESKNIDLLTESLIRTHQLAEHWIFYRIKIYLFKKVPAKFKLGILGKGKIGFSFFLFKL